MNRIIGLAISIAVILFAASCSKNSTSTESDGTDQEQIQQLSSNEYSDYFTFDDLEENDATFDNGSTTSPTDELDSTIAPTRWGRVIRSENIVREVSIDSLAPDTARIHVIRTVSGVMRLVVNNSRIEKPFTDIYHRYGVFHRIARTSHRYRNWVLVRVSGIEGRTQNTTDVAIGSVKWYKKASNDVNWIQIGTTVVNPTSFWQLRDSIPHYVANDLIRVEVTMSHAGNWFGVLHYRPWRMAGYRRAFITENDSVFTITGQIPASQNGALRRLYIDFMTDGTVHDSDAPYAADIWGLMYRVN